MSISCLDLDASGALWVGTLFNGLYCYQNGRVSHFSLKEGLKSDTINCLIEDRDGCLWVGMAYGVNRIKDGKVMGLPSGFDISCFVSAFHEDEDGRMWIGTLDKGLMSLDKNGVESFTVENGFCTNSILSIIEDDQQRFWISCEKGIFLISKNELAEYGNHKISRFRYRLFNESDGLISSGIGPSGGFSFAAKTHDGRLWFSTCKGLAMIDPQAPFNRHSFKAAFIKSLSANGQSFAPSGDFVFPPETKRIDFLLDVINFRDYKDTRIRHRLLGLDEKWTEIKGDAELTARYDRLRKGTYKFELEILDSNDEWTDCGSPISIRIRPQFHQTVFFYILVAALAAGVFFVGNKAKKRWQIKKRLKKYESAKLTEEKSEAYLKTIVDLMEKETLFKNKDLNLSKLAERASIPTAFISQILHTQLKTNFYDFINMYRVNHAKTIILSPKNAYFKIEAIGRESGFKSKSSFFRAFKKFTGMTPSEFRKNHSPS